MQIKKITKAPGWLELNVDKTGFLLTEDRAAIVSRIFQMSIEGTGGYTIAKLLNDEGAPAFGASKRWDQSTIHNMLSSRATIGEYQKKRKLNGREVPVGDPIPNYYPPVIDLETFEAAQKARQKNLTARRGRKGALVTNLFAGSAVCMYCESTVKLHNAQVKSLICRKVHDREGCFRAKWSYTDFEECFLQSLLRLDASFRPRYETLQAALVSADNAAIYCARMAVAQHIRSVVRELKIAFAGLAPEPMSSATIRKDHADRFFELILMDGRSQTGKPAIKRKERLFTIDSNEICRRLGLTQRQGLITALLVHGETLGSISGEIGMSLSTARWHLREIFKRVGCHSQAELILLAKAIEQQVSAA